jgi:hypothetical protein
MGVLCCARGHHVDALRYFKKALEVDPNNRQLLVNRAALLKHAKRKRWWFRWC